MLTSYFLILTLMDLNLSRRPVPLFDSISQEKTQKSYTSPLLRNFFYD